MIKIYLKQAWELLKQNKLFSLLYIAGKWYLHGCYYR